MRMSDSEKNPESSPAKMEEKEEAKSQKEEPMDTADSEPAANVGAGGDGPSTSDPTKEEGKVSDDAAEEDESEKASSGDEEEVKEKPADKKEEKKENNEDDEEDEEEEEAKETAKKETVKKETAKKETVKKETVKKETPKKETPKRTPKKAKLVEKSEEEDEEDEEPKLGLLEQPVIIQSGKRTKRKVERLEIAVSTPKETNIDIPEGTGTRLGDIPAVEHHLNRNLADDLKPIHRILFGKVGQSSTVKKNIRKFNGFSFDADSTEFKKKQQILSKMTNPMLKPICETLTLERSGSKETLVTRIMEFLLKPQDTGKSVPQKRKRKSKTGGEKKEKRKSKGDKEKKVKKETKKTKKEDGSGDEEDGDEEESVEEEGTEESEKEVSASESEEEEKPKKKKAKVETKKPAPKKAAPKKKKEESESEEEDENEESESEEEEKPKEKAKKAAPKKKKAPSDDDIKDTVKKILEGANLEEVTMKTVCKQVYAKFPGFDLSHKKEFIKASVKQIIR